MEDFSKSLIGYLEPNIISKHLAHLEKFNFGEERISFKNYCNFHEFFHEYYSKIESKLKNKGVMSKNKLKKMIEEFKKEKNAAITNAQIEVFLYALDLNGKLKKKLKSFNFADQICKLRLYIFTILLALI